MAIVNGTLDRDLINRADGVTDQADQIFGLAGNDTIFGFGGNDTIVGGSGADTIDGGEGSDTASYADSTSGVRVSLATGNGVGGDAQDDTLINIENLAGSAFADFLTGDRFANVLQGNGGDDRFIGGGGGDHLIGGNGFDTAEYSDSLTGVTVNLATGEASGGTAQDDRLDGIEAVVGSLFDDFLIGDELNNGLFGAAGDDNLNGGEGHDRVIGGSGNDNVKGAAGNDRLEGGIGNDWILGGIGRDIMLGGEEADTFAWQSTAETGLNGTTADVVDDFSRAEGDLLDFWAIDADTTASGNQSFAFIGNQAFTAAGQLRCFTSGNHTYIELIRTVTATGRPSST